VLSSIWMPLLEATLQVLHLWCLLLLLWRWCGSTLGGWLQPLPCEVLASWHGVEGRRWRQSGDGIEDENACVVVRGRLQPVVVLLVTRVVACMLTSDGDETLNHG